MCIIAVCDKRKLLKSEFDGCWDSNPDGMGFAYMKNGVVYAEKGLMEKERAWKRYVALENFPHVAHFRIGTSGLVCRELTHPFVVSMPSKDFISYSGDEHPVIFHNGIISQWETLFLKMLVEKGVTYKGRMVTLSDTKAFAMMLSEKAGVVDQKSLDIFSAELKSSAGKFAMFFPKLGEKGSLCTFGNFTEDNGIHFSNDTHKYGLLGSGWENSYGYLDMPMDAAGNTLFRSSKWERDNYWHGIPKPNRSKDDVESYKRRR